MCYHNEEVNHMDEQNYQEIPQEEGYTPRPKWQVWGARVALVVFILGLVLYYCNIFGVVR